MSTATVTLSGTMIKTLTLSVYGTTWVGETCYRQDAETALELKTSKDVAGDIARKGSLALVLFSMIPFAGSIFLPWVIQSLSGYIPGRWIPTSSAV